jgi:hypothetical protein
MFYYSESVHCGTDSSCSKVCSTLGKDADESGAKREDLGFSESKYGCYRQLAVKKRGGFLFLPKELGQD